MVQVAPDKLPNRICDLFANKTLLITGGSGFLGKVLIEKLLRSCTGLKKIYVIVRAKKGKSPEERMREIFDGPLFEVLKKQEGKDVFNKVEAVIGDVSAINLGLSEEDRKKLCDETEIIYHSAATVRFDEDFRQAVFLNVRGTKSMLQLAKECKNLLAMCYISTAYCHEDQEVLEEKTYPSCSDPHRIIEICEWMSDPLLQKIMPDLQGPHANTYTFTKALAESLVEEQMSALPVIIQRPAAVIPPWLEPLPGWIDNVNGPVGLLVGAGKGVIRTMYGRGDSFADYVPADIVANAFICSAFDFITHRERRIYNIVGSDEVKITFQETLDLGKSILCNEVPFNVMLWYPGGSLKQSKILHYIAFFLFQFLPALFIDMILLLVGVKPFLMRVQKKIWNGYTVFEYYTNRRWNFNKKSSKKVREILNAKERQMFRLDGEGLNYHDYFLNCIVGARRYILKEPDHTIPMARRRIKLMWFLDRFVKILIAYALCYYLYQFVSKV